MTRWRYSKKESLNRILTNLEGKEYGSDIPEEMTGLILSEDEALSDLAMLTDDELTGETLIVPYTWLPIASVVQANAGTSNVVLLTPASHGWSHEYGGIYTTGTVSQTFTASTWTKITGAFQGEMENSGAEITCDWNDDRILINEIGTYFVSWNLCLYTDGDAKTFVDAKAYVNAVGMPSTRNRAQWTITGSYVAFSGGAFVPVANSGYYVDLRLQTSATVLVNFESGQLMVQKMIG